MVQNDAIRTTLAELTDRQPQKAMERFTVLRPVLEVALPLSTAAAHANISIRTAQRWLARRQAMGLSGLVRPVRSDAGHRRSHPRSSG